MVETKVQNGVCSISWPGKGKINTKQLLHSSVRYLAHPRQELPLLPALTGNYLADKQPPRPPLTQGRQTMGLSLQPPEAIRLGNTRLFLMSYLSTNCCSMSLRNGIVCGRWHFFLTCSDKATFSKLSEKPKNQRSPRVSACLACPSALRGMLSQV